MLHSLAVAAIQLVLAPVYDGLERKVRAAIHTRIGPPVLQTWYDIVKLFSKEVVVPVGGSWYALVAVLEMLTLVTASVLLVHVSSAGLNRAALFEASVFIVLTGIATTLAVVRAVSQSNVFSVLGGFREFSLMISAEPFLATSLLLLISGAEAPASKAIAALVLVIAAYVISGRVPYDIAEAEPELASGVNIELAGPLLGVATLSVVLKKFISATLTALALTSWSSLVGIASLAAAALLTPIIWIAHTVVGTLLGRSRVDLAVRFLYTTLFILSSMLLVSYGLGV